MAKQKIFYCKCSDCIWWNLVEWRKSTCEGRHKDGKLTGVDPDLGCSNFKLISSTVFCRDCAGFDEKPHRGKTCKDRGFDPNTPVTEVADRPCRSKSNEDGRFEQKLAVNIVDNTDFFYDGALATVVVCKNPQPVCIKMGSSALVVVPQRVDDDIRFKACFFDMSSEPAGCVPIIIDGASGPVVVTPEPVVSSEAPGPVVEASEEPEVEPEPEVAPEVEPEPEVAPEVEPEPEVAPEVETTPAVAVEPEEEEGFPSWLDAKKFKDTVTQMKDLIGKGVPGAKAVNRMVRLFATENSIDDGQQDKLSELLLAEQ